MRRILVTALLTSTVIAGAVTGLGASLGVQSHNLGSGVAPVSSCDADGVDLSYTVVLGAVVAVVVSGIADGSATAGSGACDGETVYVELLANGNPIAGASGDEVNAGDVDLADNSVSVGMGVPPLASVVTGARVTITG